MRKKTLGLNNVIVLHVPVAGVTVNPMMTAVQETKHICLKGFYRPICMEELLAAYGRHPVAYASEESSDTAFILHTSGTTSGVGKPVALSDEAFNRDKQEFPHLCRWWDELRYGFAPVHPPHLRYIS